MNAAADAAPHTLRISMDAKETVAIELFSRDGTSRIPTQAVDHDFQPEEKLTPGGILMPKTDALFVYGVISKVMSACLVDCLTQWWQAVSSCYHHLKMLVITLDNGPESHSRRIQFIKRLVEVDFVDQTG